MCLVEQKTYIHPDGHSEVVETTHRCYRATGSRLCARTEHKYTETARLVEMKPTSKGKGPESRDAVVINNREGRERLYRDVTRRASKRLSKRGSKSSSIDPSPIDSISPLSSTSYVDVRPRAPTPPLVYPDIQAPPGPRVSFADEMSRIVGPDGTAIYDKPPSIDMPRAVDNERIMGGIYRSPSYRSASSGEPGDYSPVTASSSSPGLSQLRQASKMKHDSAKDLPSRSSKDSGIYRPRADTGESSKHRRQKQSQDEDNRQAQLERDRIAESDRRQEARRNAKAQEQEASRERHRREAADALEGNTGDLRQQQVQAELAQMAREREAAKGRQRDSFGSGYSSEDRLRRDADAYARNLDSPRASVRRSTVGNSNPLDEAPLLPRTGPYGSTAVHQVPASRRSSTLRERGEEVIAREQARVQAESAEKRVQASSQRLANVMNSPDMADDDGDDVAERYVGEGARRRRARVEERKPGNRRS